MNKLEQKEIPEQKGSRENPYDISEYHRLREEHFEKNPREAFSFKGYITSQRDKKLYLYDLTTIDNDRTLEGRTDNFSDRSKMRTSAMYSNQEYSIKKSLQGEATGPTFSVRAGGKLFEFRCSEEITETDVRERIVESVYRRISFETLKHGEMDDDQFSNDIGAEIRGVLDGIKEETKGRIDYSNFYIRRHKIENREI